MKGIGPVVSVVVMMILGGADVAWSQPEDGSETRHPRMGRRGGPGPGGAGRFMIPLRRLGLTDSQRDQVRGLMEQNGEVLRQAEARVRDSRQALRETVSADVLNEGAIRAAAVELGTAEGEAAVQLAYVRAQIWQLLTPDQQVAAEQAEARMQERREQRGQRVAERRERLRGRQQQ